MDLSAFITTVAETYDRHAGLTTPTQELLRRAGTHLQAHIPAGLHIAGSGGKGTATLTPWVGLFDPNETTSPEEGLYVVYLFAADMRSVSLMLLQGITKLDRQLGHQPAREYLTAEAAAIRERLPAEAMEEMSTSVDLATVGFRQRAYSSACVAALTYPLDALPSEQLLRSDLARMLDLYQEAVDVKRELALNRSRTSTGASAAQEQIVRTDPLAYFRPKNDADYIARLERRELVKSRRHERIIREYGEWIAARGFRPSTTEHPKDLVLRRDDRVWLVEGKVLYRGNATVAVRAAVGQLFQYRHFLYRDGSSPRLVALFGEPIGDAFVDFLEEVGIASVWKQSGTWLGSSTAVVDGIAERL